MLSRPTWLRGGHLLSRESGGLPRPGLPLALEPLTRGPRRWLPASPVTPGTCTPGHAHTRGTLTPRSCSHLGRSHLGHTHAHGMVTPMARSHPEEQLRAPAQLLTSVRPPLSSSHQATRKLGLTSHPHFAVPRLATSSQEGACTHTCCTCRRRGSVSAAPDSKVNGCSCPGRV